MSAALPITPHERRFAVALGALARAGERAEHLHLGGVHFGDFQHRSAFDLAQYIAASRTHLLQDWAGAPSSARRAQLIDIAEGIVAQLGQARRNARHAVRRPRNADDQTVSGDRPTIYQAQRAEAARLFGLTAIMVPGTQNRFEPALSTSYARRILDFWTRDVSAVMRDVDGNALDSAHGRKYQRDGIQLAKLSEEFDRLPDAARRLDDEDSVRVWRAIERVAHTGMAIATSPSSWTLIGEALDETIDGLRKKLPNLPDLTSVLALIAAIAIVPPLLNAFSSKR